MSTTNMNLLVCGEGDYYFDLPYRFGVVDSSKLAPVPFPSPNTLRHRELYKTHVESQPQPEPLVESQPQPEPLAESQPEPLAESQIESKHNINMFICGEGDYYFDLPYHFGVVDSSKLAPVPFPSPNTLRHREMFEQHIASKSEP